MPDGALRLDGRVVVTGGNRGLGAAMVAECVGADASVVAVGRDQGRNAALRDAYADNDRVFVCATRGNR